MAENFVEIEPIITKKPAREFGENTFIVDFGIDLERKDNNVFLIIKAKDKTFRVKIPKGAISYLLSELYDIESSLLLSQEELRIIHKSKIEDVALWYSPSNILSGIDFIINKNGRKYLIEIFRPLSINITPIKEKKK